MKTLNQHFMVLAFCCEFIRFMNCVWWYLEVLHISHFSSMTVDGGWSSWGGWTTCTKTCEIGTQTRTRSCTQPAPQYDGKTCPEAPMEERVCNTHPCPGKTVIRWGEVKTPSVETSWCLWLFGVGMHPDREITENHFTATENILQKKTFVHPLGFRQNLLREQNGQSRAGYIGPSCPLGKPIRTQNSPHRARSRSLPCNNTSFFFLPS